MNARRWFVGLVLICVSVGTASLRGVELAPEQRDKLVWIDQSLQKVVTLYREKKTDDMQKLIGEIETAISAVQSASAGQDVEAVLNPFRVRLASAQHSMATQAVGLAETERDFFTAALGLGGTFGDGLYWQTYGENRFVKGEDELKVSAAIGFQF